MEVRYFCYYIYWSNQYFPGDLNRLFVLQLIIVIVAILLYIWQDVYKVPSFKVERQVHKVVTPPLENLFEFGDIIATDCHFYETYKLVKADEPFGELWIISNCALFGIYVFIIKRW